MSMTSATEVIAQHESDGNCWCPCGGTPGRAPERNWAAHVLDELSKAGYAVIELPEPEPAKSRDTRGEWLDELVRAFDDRVELDMQSMTPQDSRDIAAALLAAAVVAEVGE